MGLNLNLGLSSKQTRFIKVVMKFVIFAKESSWNPSAPFCDINLLIMHNI